MEKFAKAEAQCSVFGKRLTTFQRLIHANKHLPEGISMHSCVHVWTMICIKFIMPVNISVLSTASFNMESHPFLL